MDIRPVPARERNLAGLDFFLLWAGVAISLGEYVGTGIILYNTVGPSWKDEWGHPLKGLSKEKTLPLRNRRFNLRNCSARRVAAWLL